MEKIGLDLIAHIPWEEVVNLRTTLPHPTLGGTVRQDVQPGALHLVDMDVSTSFVEPDVRGSQTLNDLLPSLDSISIIRPVLSDGDWGPFIDFLTRRAAVSNRISSLKIDGFPYMDADVVERILRMWMVTRMVTAVTSGRCTSTIDNLLRSRLGETCIA